MVNIIYEFSGEHRFLSNFFMHPVQWHGACWPSAEHAYQAAKFLVSNNPEWAIEICKASTAGIAKKMGRMKHVVMANWEPVKLTTMEEIVRAKFKSPELRRKLIQTRDAELQEGNWWGDRYWGISPAGSGEGENHLGIILMQIRKELR